MGILLMRVKWQIAFMYLDHIDIFLWTPHECIDPFWLFMTSLYDNGVQLNLNQCEFFTNHIDYLGHVIRPGLLEHSTRKISTIHELKQPTNVIGLRSYLGFVRSSAAPVRASLLYQPFWIKKHLKGHFQTFDWLSHDKIITLEFLKAKLVEPL